MLDKVIATISGLTFFCPTLYGCVYVVFLDGPIMSESYLKMAVDANLSADLVCRARGWPAPTMIWSRHAASLSDASKYHITEHRDGELRHVSTLNISSIKQDDLGIYSCTAQNVMGVNSTDFNLTVKSEPVFLLLYTL